jgi:phage baseplate assembly protein W
MGIDQSKNKIYAYDLSKKVLTKGEVHNEDAINTSIENILSTSYGERIFMPDFGSPLVSMLFENLTPATGDQLISDVIRSIEKWEDRIFIYHARVTMQLLLDNNTVILSIPYSIIQNNTTGTFKKKIVFA